MGFSFKKIRASGEIASIEFLRGIASAMVCYFHLSNGNNRFLPETSIVRKAGMLGWTGVEIFFVISGFVIPYAMFKKNYTVKNFGVFMKKRIIRIEPPYLISIVMVLMLNFISTLSPYYRGLPYSTDWVNVLSHIAYLNVFTGGTWLNPVYWSLAIEFQYYLLIAFLFTLIASDKIYYRLLFFAGFAALSFLPLPPNRFIFNYAGYFLVGILVFQWVCNIIDKREFLILLAAAGLLLYFTQGLGLAVLTLVTSVIIIYLNEVPAFFKYLGVISYSLYLIHVPLGGRIINISETLIHNTIIRECVVIGVFVFSIIAASIFYKYVEKIFKKISGEIKYDTRPVPDKVVVAIETDQG